MDYSRYRMSLKEEGKLLLLAAGLSLAAAVLFYDCLWYALAAPLVYGILRKLEIQKKIRERQRLLTEEFLDMLRSLSSALMAGFSIENAVREAYGEMKLLHGNGSFIAEELRTMLQGLSVSIPLEKLLQDFALRSGCPDIMEFSEVFGFARHGSGDLAGIIGTTAANISGRYETEKEIEVAIASRKMEQKVMNAIPVFLLAYLKLTDPDYMEILYGNLFGVCFMTLCLAAYGTAIWLSQKLMDIQV